MTLKDLHNLKAALNQHETETEALVNVLQDFLQSNERGRVALVLAEDSTLEALFLQTSAMVDSFSRFPELVFMDSTYSTNNLNMPVFTLGVMDGDGIGQPAAYVLLLDETKPSLTRALQIFKQYDQCHESVETVIVDKDASEIAAVQQEFPSAQVIICLFHAMKALRQAVSQHIKDTAIQEEVFTLIRALTYSHSEKLYDEAF